MQIKKIKISNYKKLLNIELNLENDITLIAGPNNAGKTSIVEIFKFLFTDNKNKIELSELNTKLLNDWIRTFYINYESVIKRNFNDDELPVQLTDFFLKFPINDENILPIINIQIVYDKKNDRLTDVIRYSYELDDSNSIYFMYKCCLNEDKFKKNLIENNKKILSRYKNKNINETQRILSIIRIIKKIFQSSIDEAYYYTNSDYFDENLIKTSEFKSLFNVKIVNALRKLDDEKNDSNYSLSKSMISIASKKDEFSTKLNNISDSLYQKLEENNIEEFILKESMSNFNSELRNTSGGEYFAKIGLLINPELDDLNNLLKETTTAQYDVDSYNLEEYSQGLGYSNMVYMHMIQQGFENSFDKSKINIMIIEEPESHMHPQMQSSFFKKILSYYGSNESQCIISTHSTEIVNNIEDIRKIRVIRNTKNAFESKMYDLKKFFDKISEKKYDESITKIDFYNFFFTVGFPNLIFSNKAILFEGDSERILLKNIIKKEYKELYNDYISYVQVGGAYAKNYFDLLKYLNIKTLVLTDIDYGTDDISKDEILNSTSTNATINYGYSELSNFLTNPNSQIESLDRCISENTIENIYKSFNNNDNNDLIGIFTQTSDDFYSRTLEEAMLTKYLNMMIWDTKAKEEWLEFRKNSNLKFSIPRKEGNISIRDIIISSSNNKVDFMYSVILTSKQSDMLPNYIKKGLVWLNGKE